MADQLWMQGWSYNESDHWADRANCKGKAFELFEFQEKDSPLAAGMSFRERQEFNLTNFEIAAEICIECPVFFECKEKSTAEDRHWTVRAGEPPTRFRAETPADGGRYCQRGHWLPEGGRCTTCKRDAMAKRRQNARLDKAAAAL